MDEFFVCSFEGTIYLQYGPVAQLVRAPPCHGGGREFESLLGRLRWGLSSAGRASALQAEGHRFEPCRPHLLNKDGFFVCSFEGIGNTDGMRGSTGWCCFFLYVNLRKHKRSITEDERKRKPSGSICTGLYSI